MQINPQHLIEGAEFHPSPHVNARPDEHDISLLVIHNISLPPGEFGSGDIDALFMGTLDCTQHPSYDSLNGVRVSAHVVISREGDIIQYVPFHQRAWHAGVSCFEGRENCNDFAIGIELEGTDTLAYSDSQYDALQSLTRALITRYPNITLDRIVGHEDIAPQRKTDPGPAFDWHRYKQGI